MAQAAPPGTREKILDASRSAFLDGMAAGSRVAAVACVAGGVLALAFLGRKLEVPIIEDDPLLEPEPAVA